MLEGVFKSMVWKLDRDWSSLGLFAPCEQFLHASAAVLVISEIFSMFGSNPNRTYSPLLPVRFGRIRTG